MDGTKEIRGQAYQHFLLGERSGSNAALNSI